MAKEFKSLTDLNNYIVKQTMKAMQNKFYKIFENTWNKYITKWYEEYTPKWYQRSYQFRDKLAQEIKCHRVGNEIICGIEFNEKNLKLDQWVRFDGKSIDRYTSEDTESGVYEPNEIIRNSLMEGGHGFREHTETKPYVDTVKELESLTMFIGVLKSELRSNGFVVK